MSLNTNKDLKQFYGISEVAKMFDVNESTLRFWEKEFSNIAPQKVGGGVRRYTKADIEQVRIVHGLVKVRGLKIAAARQALKKNHEGTVKMVDVIDRLRRVREELVSIRTEMAALA